MKLAPTAQKLYDTISQFEIIDAHEHLPPEKIRVAMKQDVFTLFSHYTAVDLISAGMTRETYDRLMDPDQPLDSRWKEFEPFLPAVRHGSYARPAFIAAREFYGADDISASTYHALSERIQAENKPGIYRRILGDKCRIKLALTQHGDDTLEDDPILACVRFIFRRLVPDNQDFWAETQAWGASLGLKIKTLDDYVEMLRTQLAQWKEAGAVGMKIRATAYCNPGREAAESAFNGLAEGRWNEHLNTTVLHYVHELCVEMAADLGWTVAVHCGMWGDFRDLDAQHMIPFVQRHPDVRFDFYHMSMPNVRPCMVIAKNFPNVFLNFCWTHIISQRMTCSALDEVMDLVPLNKISAFGGDYIRPVEKVYGHLVMAREDIAVVLGRRVDEGSLGMDEATQIAHQWFFENPKRIYGLEV